MDAKYLADSCRTDRGMAKQGDSPGARYHVDCRTNRAVRARARQPKDKEPRETENGAPWLGSVDVLRQGIVPRVVHTSQFTGTQCHSPHIDMNPRPKSDP